MNDFQLLERMRAETPSADPQTVLRARRRVLRLAFAPQLSQRRLRSARSRVLTAAVSVIALAGVVFGGVVTFGGRTPTNRADAATLALQRAALNARGTDKPVAKAGQYFHVHEVALATSFKGTANHIAFERHGTTDTWLPADGRGPAYLRVVNGRHVIEGPINAKGRQVGEYPHDSLSYKYLASLPTNPTKLFDLLRNETLKCDCGQSLGEQMLKEAGDWLQFGTPTTALRAATFAALSKIPNMTLEQHVKMPDGATGVGVSVVSDTVRHELVFNPNNGAYLGVHETYVTADPSHGIAAGDVFEEASYTVTVVNHLPRHRPDNEPPSSCPIPAKGC